MGNCSNNFQPDFSSPRIDSSVIKEVEESDTQSNNKVQENTKKSDLPIRLISGACYAAFIIAGCMLTNIGTMIMLMVVSGITASEFFSMLRSDAKLPNETLGVIGAVAFPPAIYFFQIYGILAVVLCLMLMLLIWYVFWPRARITDVCVSFFGAIYTGGLLSLLLVMRSHVDAPEPFPGLFLIVVFFALTWNDSAAYLFGRKLGKHSLAPHISPKKSWEGFIIGVIFGSVCWLLMYLVPGVNITIGQCLLFGFVTSVAGVIGDLVESRIKRNSGVKDSGNLLPGHGGLLDRMDSVFLVSLFSFLLLFGFGCLSF